MAIGEYEFGTSQHETMSVTSGALTVLLPNANDWQTFKAGESFKVDADQTFQVKSWDWNSLLVLIRLNLSVDYWLL